MSKNLNKKEVEKFSRQIILKNIGALGQKKILGSKVLIIGMGGLGCPAADFLTRSGIGTLESALTRKFVVLPRVAPNTRLPKSLVEVILLKSAGSIVCTDRGTIGPKPIVGNQTLLSVVAFPLPFRL